MDGTPDSSSPERDTREATARRLVQSLLVDDKETVARFDEIALPDSEYELGPWSTALSNLVDRLSRLEQLEREFDETLLREKLASMRELAYGASHEINNPLANISSRAQTLLRDETDPDRRRKLATINSQAFRAHEMIADMMLFAKPPDLVRQRLNLSELIARVVQELSPQATEQGTSIVVVGVDEDCPLMADATHLAVAIKALCNNALEAIGAGGQVTVALVESETTIDVAVSDTGPGIPEAVRPHLFDPFYSGREAGRGLGFGLSKCWRIVELHGGVIEVSGSGADQTCFTLRLPAFYEQAADAPSPVLA